MKVRPPYLRIGIPLVAIFLILVLITGGFIIYSDSPNTIQKYDDVKIDYTVWESDESRHYNVLNPVLDTILWVNMLPITENHTSGLILGLYNNLLGKNLYYQSRIIWLNRCIDQDRNGIDDITGRLALTFGNNSDLYFNTCLMIQFKILGIQKGPDSFESIFQKNEISNFVFQFLYIAFQIIYPILLLSIPIFMAIFIDYLDKHRIKKVFVFKYGLMVSIICTIPFIIWGLVISSMSSPELNLLKTQYWFFLPLINSLIIISCIVFIPIYLMVYKIVKRKRTR